MRPMIEENALQAKSSTKTESKEVMSAIVEVHLGRNRPCYMRIQRNFSRRFILPCAIGQGSASPSDNERYHKLL